jgi:metallo-beta-lactamase family protein
LIVSVDKSLKFWRKNIEEKDEKMKLHFYGAAQTVTGSQHLIEVNGSKLLLECGLYQGRRKNAFERNRWFPFDPSTVDAVILSHAHIDHSGNLPNLMQNGFKGFIYAQEATASLVDLMLQDSGRIQEHDVKYVNKRRERQGKKLFEPLYTEEQAKKVAKRIIKIAYNTPFEPIPGVIVHFVEAGHILGSTAVVLDIEEKGRKYRLWFSGDIGRKELPLLRDPVMPSETDYLVMECTYGYKPHHPLEEGIQRLRTIVNQTIDHGGKVIIPAFAVGRTQEIVYTLNQMRQKNEIPPVPVFVDSPLAVNITRVFLRHTDLFDESVAEMLRTNKSGSALGFDMLTYVHSVEESKALNERKDPMIIISASGMVENGRILHHLQHNIHDPRSAILIISWNAPHTLGRRLVEGEKRVKIFGESFVRKIKVHRINGFSAHGGQTMLRDYALSVKGRVKDIFLVHGEKRGAEGLSEILRSEGLANTHFPERCSIVEI